MQLEERAFICELMCTISLCTPSSLALLRATIAHRNLPCAYSRHADFDITDCSRLSMCSCMPEVARAW